MRHVDRRIEEAVATWTFGQAIDLDLSVNIKRGDMPFPVHDRPNAARLRKRILLR